MNSLYGPAMSEAIASNNLEQMKSVAEQAKVQIDNHEEIKDALVELQEAIEKLENN